MITKFNIFNEQNASIFKGYHGSNFSDLTKENIKINFESDEMFYGAAFYVANDIELAKNYGNNIYEIQYSGNFYKVLSRELLGTYGTFQQYLDMLLDSYKENILDYIKENPKDWLSKLKIEKDELIELYNISDSDALANYFIENNKDNLFEEYIENQNNIRDEYIEEEYDGLTDNVQTAIFFPEKNIISIKKI